MSNRTGTGRGTGPEERSVRGSVRSLFPHEAEGAGAIGTEEWYETERLTGQITGRARASDRPEPAEHQMPIALKWRHAEASPPPSRLVRLRRRLERGHRRTAAIESHVPVTASLGTTELASAGLGSPGDERPTDAIASRRLANPPPPATDEADARTSERLGWRSPSGASTSVRSDRSRLRRGAILVTIALSLAAAAMIATASETGGSAPKRSSAGLLAGASTPVPGLTLATDRVILALGIVAHDVSAKPRASRIVRIRRPSHRFPVRTAAHSSSGRSTKVATQKESTSAPVVSANVPSASSSNSSSSSPAYSPPPSSGAAVSEPAQTASRSAPQPAGPTSLGGVVGTNCNPKCR